MEKINKLLECYDKIIMSKLINKGINEEDFQELLEIAKELNKLEMYNFDISSKENLMESIKTFQRNLLK